MAAEEQEGVLAIRAAELMASLDAALAGKGQAEQQAAELQQQVGGVGQVF